MSPILSLIGALLSALIFATAIIMIKESDKDTLLGLSFIDIIAGLSLLALTLVSATEKETLILDKNIDHDKTKIVEENGEPTELYITVNGEEYHFTFKEVSESNK